MDKRGNGGAGLKENLMLGESSKLKIAFFGTPGIAVTALEEMKVCGYTPSLVVCNPDMPVGRKHILTPPPTKVWALANNIPVFQPQSLKSRDELKPLTEEAFDFFVVFAYGKIIPSWLLELPTYMTINGHPSLLPKLRGASPIRSTLLHDLDACGVTIIRMDEKLDHGPILIQQKVDLPFPILGTELDEHLAHIVGLQVCEAIEQVYKGTISETPQDDTRATYCGKITKEMAEISIDPHQLPSGEQAYAVYRKLCAYDGWPVGFFVHQGKRVKITKARLHEGALAIQQVVPEGKNEMDYTVFLESI
jgi:methionyl-tRNA formyltransferase